MKLFTGVSEHGDLYRMGAAILAAVLMVVLFVLTKPVDLYRHNLLLSYLSDMRSDEARLGETVLKLNFNLLNNYDKVNAIIDHMREVIHELREGQLSGSLHNEVEFQQKLGLLEQRLSAQTDLLEQFKSSNAVLRNSLIYLPRARNDLERDLPPLTKAHIDDLVEQIMLVRIRGVTEHDDLNAAIAAVQNDTSRLPVSIRQKFDHLVLHIRHTDQITRDMPSLVRQLTSNTEISGLADAYRHYYDNRQQRAAAYRIFLLLAVLALVGYAVRVLIRVRQQTNQLKLAASVFASASEGVTITDTKGTILEVNSAFTTLTGYTRKEVIGKNPRVLQSGRHGAQFYAKMWQQIGDTGLWQGEMWNRRKNGEIYLQHITITAVKERNGVIVNYVGMFDDITKSKEDEQEIQNLAFYDPLTHLPNRRLLMDRLPQALASSIRSGREGALLFIDLDNFKTLNDTLGHHTGDLLLQQVSQRLKSCIREGDTVARLGGDEFVVMLEDLSEQAIEAAEQAETVGKKILTEINQPYQLDTHEYRNSTSIGVTLFNGRKQSKDDLLKQADIAMYQAKKAGRNTLRFFDQQMQDNIHARAALEDELHKALESRQFSLYYQIQVDSLQRVLGAEALIRWNHPERGLVSPMQFIPLAEETGLILPIGQWVLETACAQIKAWEQDVLTRDLILAVNVSARQFHEADFVEQVQAAVRRYAINPMQLKLELTESMLLKKVEDTIAIMNALKEIGIRFSLDDFGTGYSSLQYLKRLPLHQLKIDQSFVRDLASDSSDRTIVRTIIAMAHGLGMDVIAEGVETEQQRHFLLKNGCSHYQGYLFGKPIPIEQFEALLKHGYLS